MSYAKAMKHHNNPRKWRRTRVKDSGGMSAAGRRGNALVFGEPATTPQPETGQVAAEPRNQAHAGAKTS